MKKPFPALAALPCRIARNGFPDERAFTISTHDGDPHDGSGDVHYFWDAAKGRLRPAEPSGDAEIEGFVAAQVLKVDGERALVEVPDARAIWVETRVIVDRPSEVRFDVPV